MTSSTSELPVSHKRRLPQGLIVMVLIGGIIFAIVDSIAVNRGLMLATDLASSFGGTANSVKTSVTWFYGLLSIGEAEHPRIWAAVGGFIMGAVYGAVCFFIIRAVVRAIRKARPSPQVADGRSGS